MADDYLFSPLYSKTPTAKKSSEFLPIRSVTYRKQRLVKLDCIQADTYRSAMQTMSSSPGLPVATPSAYASPSAFNIKASSTFASTPSSPLFNTTMHRFANSRKLEMKSPLKAIEPFKLPSPFKISTTPTTKANNSALSYSQHKKKEKLEEKPFSVKEFIHEMQQVSPPRRYFGNEVYEHYNSDEVINKPDRFAKYDQLSDPAKFSRKNIFQKNVKVLSEESIQNSNRLCFPEKIEDYENENTLATHLLSAVSHNIKHLEDLLRSLQDQMSVFRAEKDQLKLEMKDLMTKDDQERQEMLRSISNGVARCSEILKEDSLNDQNKKIILHKDVTCLQRDKAIIEKGIQNSLVSLSATETKLFGFDAFDLQAPDSELDILSLQNLRSSMQSSLTNRNVIH